MKIQNKHIYWAVGAIMVLWIAYRIFAIASESARPVYNPMREAAKHGAKIETVVVNKKTDILREPLAVKNNRAYVSCSRILKFKPGQRVGAGRITAAINKIDLDTGMCIVRTANVADGDTFAESTHTGYFVPVYAVSENTVMVAEDGIAKPVKIKPIAEDFEYVVTPNGLNDGDVVILSGINAGDKLKGNAI